LHNLFGGIALASSKAFQFVLRRLFGGPAFGLYAITYGVMEMCANFLLGGFGDAVTYHASKYVHPNEGETPFERSVRERKLYAVLASSLRTPFLISLAMSFTIFFGAGWIRQMVWSAHDIQIVSLLRTVIFALPLLTLVHLLAESTRAHLDMRLPVIVVQTMFPGLTIVIALLLHFSFGYGIESMAFGLVYSLLICLPFAIFGYRRYYSLMRTWRAIVHMEGDPDVRKFAIPQCLNMASNLGLVKLDSLMLSAWVSADSVGIYVLLTELTQLVRLPKMAFSGIFGPLVAKYQHQGNKAGIAESLASLAQITSIIGIAAIIPIHLFYPEFILGAGNTWILSLGLVWLLSVGPLMSTHFGLAGNLLLMTGHSRLLLLNSLGSLALNIVLNLLLIPHIGITGAAIATAVSNLTISSLQIYEMKRLEGYSFSIWFYHRVWLFMAMAAPILLLSLHNPLPIRIGICATLLLTLGLCAWMIPGPQMHPIRSLWKKGS
jgi:O-antigen/teichoic acid export membrane protein